MSLPLVSINLPHSTHPTAHSTSLGLIVHRILAIQRNLKDKNTYVLDSPLTKVVVVLIESGLFYTITVFVLFVVYLCGNNSQYAVSNAVVQIIVSRLLSFSLSLSGS